MSPYFEFQGLTKRKKEKNFISKIPILIVKKKKKIFFDKFYLNDILTNNMPKMDEAK